MRVIITVINDISTDQRVLKQVALLRELDCDVTVIGRRLKNSPPLPEVVRDSVRLGLLFTRGPLMYIIFNIRLLACLLFRKANFYIANDLDTLLPCFVASRLFRKQLVYDSHEYFTGQHTLNGRRMKHGMWKMIEKFILPGLKWMITVSEGIASLYREEYGIDPVVVRNVSYSAGLIEARKREELGVSSNDLLVVLQGTGINHGRGADQLLNAMSMTEGVSLMIIGEGDDMNVLKQQASPADVSGKVIFLPRMPWEQMISYTMCCDAGLTLDPDISLNQRFSLPNKLFDYIAAGIPVIASPLPEVMSVLRKYDCGIVLEKVSPEHIAMALNKLQHDRLLLASLKSNAVKASEDLLWEKEKLIEQELFINVISCVKNKTRQD